MNKELALNGGTPVISRNFSPYSPIGVEEIESVRKVMKGMPIPRCMLPKVKLRKLGGFVIKLAV